MTATETLAIVLRSTAYGEADRVVTLFGRTVGRVAAVARAARKSQRRFGGGLGYGSVGTAVLRDKAGAELATLERFEPEAPAPRLDDLVKAAHVAYALELVEKLTPQRQPDAALFDWTLAVLTTWSSDAPATAATLRVFELGLLRDLGLAPALDRCVVCGRSVAADESVRWMAARGGVACSGCAATGRPVSPPVRAALLALGSGGFDTVRPELSREHNALARELIGELLGLHLSAPLKSLTFIAKLQAR